MVAWVDLNHRPRPYQGLLWCYMHSRRGDDYNADDLTHGHVMAMIVGSQVARSVEQWRSLPTSRFWSPMSNGLISGLGPYVRNLKGASPPAQIAVYKPI